LLTTTAISELQKRVALYEDMKAYEELYYLLSAPLQKFSYSIVRVKEASEEIVSDVFIKLWQIRGRLTEVENLRVYLYTITKNFSINYIHKHYKNIPLSLNDIDIEPVVGMPDPADMLVSAEIVGRIKAEIMKLPPQCRLVFQLIKEEGFKYKEVAEILNLSVLTVRNQLSIAVKKIAAVLPEYSNRRFSPAAKFSAS
jgi:RNA polymerase sigma-70 factor (family 1)